MAEDSTEVPTLLTLTVDCLAHIAGFLTVHDLIYTLPATCTSLRAVADDPVVWANVLVEPCCEKELLWLAEKYPSIRYIRYDNDEYDYDDPRADELLSKVAAAFPSLAYCKPIESKPAGAGLALTSGRLSNSSTVLPAAYGSLRSVDVYDGDLETLSTLSSSCPQLRTVVCPGLIGLGPQLFPRATRIKTDGKDVTGSNWSSFVGAHPALAALTIDAVALDPATDPALADAPPARLTFFRYSVGRARSDEERAANTAAVAFGVWVTAGCPNLHTLRWYASTPDALLDSLAEYCPKLQVLFTSAIYELSDEALQRFGERACLRSWDTSDSNTGASFAAMMAPALGKVRVLPRWAIRGEAVPLLVGRLARVTVLSVSEGFPPGHIQSILAEATCLKELVLRESGDLGVREKHCAVLAPAAATLEAVTIFNANGHHEELLEAVGRSTTVSKVEINIALQVDTRNVTQPLRVVAPLIAGLEARGPGHVYAFFTLTGMNTECAELVRSALARGLFSAHRVRLSVRYGGGVDTSALGHELEKMASPCVRRWDETQLEYYGD